MTVRRVVLCSLLIILSVVIEATVLAPLDFPGATPSLVLVTVAALAFAFGPITGSASGFAAGLLLDLAPPATGTLGISALILTLVGYALGRVFDSDSRPLVFTTVLTAGAAAIAILASAALGGLLGNPRIVWSDVPVMVLTGALYAAILALPIIPLVNRLSRAFVPEAFPR